MAVIAITQRNAVKDFLVSTTTLTASDTLVWTKGAGMSINLTNPTGSPVTVTFLGNGATTVPGPIGLGGTINVSGGFAVIVAATSTKHLVLDNIALYLTGTSVAVTGGTGVTAQCLTN